MNFIWFVVFFSEDVIRVCGGLVGLFELMMCGWCMVCGVVLVDG